MSEQSQPATPCKKGRRWRFWLVLVLVAMASGFTGVIAAKAFGYRHGFGHGFGPGMMMGAPADADEAAERASWMIRQFSRHINATAEQKTKLAAIATATAKDVFPMREKMIAARRQAIDLMRQPAVARDQIESLRAGQIANVDAISKRLAQAAGDMAEVLTPEQRKELVHPAGSSDSGSESAL